MTLSHISQSDRVSYQQSICIFVTLPGT